MGRRKYYRTIYCIHHGCNKFIRREYETRKEYADGEKAVTKFKCVYHTDIDSVMSLTNTHREVELKCVEKFHCGYASKYWQYKKDWGTEKVDSGFTYGTGYKMDASHFPVGTIIKVTVQVVLPDSKESEVQHV